MAHVPTPPTASRTPLWGLGFMVDLIAYRFDKLRNDIADIWLLGTWLSYPFYAIAYYVFAARDLIWDADDSLVDVITWLKGITEGNVVIDILERLWSEFTHLRSDPRGWVSSKIDQISGELRYLRTDPRGWIRSRLYAAFPVFYTLLGSSGWWIYTKLTERYPDIGGLFTNTWGYIRDKVLGLFWWARELETNPAQMIIGRINDYAGWFWAFVQNPREFIYSQVLYYNWDINLLLSDPNRWVKEKLASLLGMSYQEIDNLTVTLIKRMFHAVLNNYQGLLDYVREALVDLMLRYI